MIYWTQSMIYDLKRSVDLRWLLMSGAIFILRWSCFMYLNYHIQQAGIIKCLQTFIYIYKQIFLANHSWSRKHISSSVGRGRRRSLLPKVNWELRNFDCSYKSPFQLASILLPLFHLLYRSWFASFCSHFHVMSLIALIYHKLVVASKRLVTYSYLLHGSQFPLLQSK